VAESGMTISKTQPIALAFSISAARKINSRAQLNKSKQKTYLMAFLLSFFVILSYKNNLFCVCTQKEFQTARHISTHQ